MLSTIVTTARAYGLQAIDGPYTDIKDIDELPQAVPPRPAGRLRRQVGAAPRPRSTIANEVFMPTQEQFDAARRLLDAYHHATQVERRGAVMHEGQMIDEASRKIAEPRWSPAARRRAWLCPGAGA